VRTSEPSSGPSPRHRGALARLEQDGLVRRDGARYLTTRRWQGAMARAALRLLDDPDSDPSEGADLRVPVAHALVELYGPDHGSEELTRFVEAMVLVEAAPSASPSGPSPG
jgi:hypothetical protein